MFAHERSDMADASSVGRRVVPRPQLFERLNGSQRVVLVSAPAGSGKTVLLRSWLQAAGLEERAAWVAVQGTERDHQSFWVALADALRSTMAGATLVRGVTAAPDLQAGEILERLLEDLSSLEDDLWLVIDDLHELRSAEALRQLELFMMRAPGHLRFVLATRHDVRLGLHRRRLEGELTEIREAHLVFTLDEARSLFEAAGVQLSDVALASLHARTEGWAAGLALAALSLVAQPDPDRFAAEFSGSERTVAEYLLIEVLDRQPGPVRRLLLRTSLLERVNGALADLLTGAPGSEEILHELADANAFVVPIDAQRSWFRYHHLLADLLQLELRRSEPSELPALHRTAAQWYAEHGYPVEAVRHAQAAEDWGLAARVLSEHWFSLYLGGRHTTVDELLAGFPPALLAADTELTALRAADELFWGSLEEAERYLALAARGLEGGEGLVPAERRGRLQVLLAVMRLWLARRRGDLSAVAEQAGRLLAPAEAADAAQLGLSEDMRALAVITLGIAEAWAGRLEDADRHLEQGVALARRAGRPYLELLGLAHGAAIAGFRSYAVGEQRSRQAIELARRHGWGEDQSAGVAYGVLGAVTVGQGRLAEAEPWLELAEQTLRTETEPVVGMIIHYSRGLLELARGRNEEALKALETAERLAGTLVTPPTRALRVRAYVLFALVRLDQTSRVEAALAGLDEHERESAEMRTALAWLRLAQNDPQAATAALAPVLDGSVGPPWAVAALLVEVTARDALGDPDAAGRALERALDLAEPDRSLVPFLVHLPPGLLKRHAWHTTAHAALISEILDLSAGTSRPAPPPGRARSLHEPLSDGEKRVLRYLPTNLSTPEIARELYLSVNTVKTHLSHIYDKFDAHTRTQAVERARALGLLAPSAVRR
ncbi:MAG: LuxR C-terminal-related transcriptional regulator [Acidimicrobiales bacterium]